MERKLTNRQLQATQTREHLFNSALELFKEKNYEDVTISDISAYAQISVGSFYRYYKSKEDLIMQAYLDFDIYIETEFDPSAFASNLDAIRHLIYMQTSGADTIGPKLFSQILRIQLKTSGKRVIEETRTFHIRMKELVERAINTEELNTDYSANEISSLILRTSRGVLFDWSIRDAPYKAHERALNEVNLILKAIQNRNKYD